MSVKMPGGGFMDYYELLGVDKLADSKQIRAAYLRHAKNHHPDAGGSTERMQLLNQAYETLSGNLSRSAYDKLHKLHTSPHDELDLREDIADTPANPTGNSEFVDDYVDSAYSEYYSKRPKARPVRRKVSTVKRTIFSMFGVAAVAGIVFVLGLMAYSGVKTNQPAAVVATQPPANNTRTTTSRQTPSTTNQNQADQSGNSTNADTTTQTPEPTLPITNVPDDSSSTSDDTTTTQSDTTTQGISDNTVTEPMQPQPREFRRFWR